MDMYIAEATTSPAPFCNYEGGLDDIALFTPGSPAGLNHHYLELPL